jgi:hypothetical protein
MSTGIQPPHKTTGHVLGQLRKDLIAADVPEDIANVVVIKYAERLMEYTGGLAISDSGPTA